MGVAKKAMAGCSGQWMGVPEGSSKPDALHGGVVAIHTHRTGMGSREVVNQHTHGHVIPPVRGLRYPTPECSVIPHPSECSVIPPLGVP